MYTEISIYFIIGIVIAIIITIQIYLFRNTKENIKDYMRSVGSADKLKVIKMSDHKTSDVKNVFYAGKPTKDRELTDVQQEPDPQKSVFKLTEIGGQKAEFEVIIAGNIMQKYITNAPDDHLYRVCNHKNSNRDFKKNIITIEKGIAERVDGTWMVKEENKALIKFE